MATKYPDLFAAIAAPFEAHEVKMRPAQGGRQLHYITARTAMNRLDEVLGPENWWDEYIPSANSVICKLTIRLPDGSEVTKQDAGGYAGMADQGDDDKSGFSDSFKRSFAKFGGGRYLYRDGVPTFVAEREPDLRAATEPPPEEGRQEPRHAPQNDSRPASRPAPQDDHQDRPAAPQGNQGGGGGGNVPKTGKALFAWTKDMEARHEVGLLKYLNGWAKLQEFPNRMIDWDSDQVHLAFHEAVRKIQSLTSGQS